MNYYDDITTSRDQRFNADGALRIYPRRFAEPPPPPVLPEPKPQWALPTTTAAQRVTAAKTRRRDNLSVRITRARIAGQREYGGAVCPHCQQGFMRRAANQEFCITPACQAVKLKAQAERQKELKKKYRWREPVSGNCEFCGAEFIRKLTTHAFCGAAECLEKARLRNQARRFERERAQRAATVTERAAAKLICSHSNWRKSSKGMRQCLACGKRQAARVEFQEAA